MAMTASEKKTVRSRPIFSTSSALSGSGGAPPGSGRSTTRSSFHVIVDREPGGAGDAYAASFTVTGTLVLPTFSEPTLAPFLAALATLADRWPLTVIPEKPATVTSLAATSWFLVPG